jgi:hypothetical protein
MRLTLQEWDHPQPATPIHIDNSTTVGIVNNTVKRQKMRSMEMHYFWLLDGQTQNFFLSSTHRQVRPLFLHTNKSPRVLLRAKMPSEQRGCVKKPEHTYLRSIHKSALPSTRIRSLPTTRIKQLNIPATNSAVGLLLANLGLVRHYSLGTFIA